MKEMTKAYTILAAGIPSLLTGSCLLFRDVRSLGFLVYAIPVAMFVVFMWQLFRAKPSRTVLHIAGGILCMIGAWFLSVLIIGAIAISQTGLEGTQ